MVDDVRELETFEAKLLTELESHKASLQSNLAHWQEA
jgi:hypothetical protein